MKHKILMTLVALFAMTTGAWADEATITLKCGTTEKTFEKAELPWSTTADILKAVVTDIDFNININAISGGDGKVVKYGNENFTVTGTFSGEATVTVTYNMGSSATITVTAPGPLLTLNDTKTEATMESMPTYDVTVDYELVRDMSVQMTAQVGDGTQEQPRYRVQWNDEKKTFEPAELNYQQVMALFSVNDLIENTKLAQTSYFVNIYAVDAEGNPTGNAMDFQSFTFAPGRYCVTATGLLGGPYDGTTAPSNIFELYQGYQVVIPAGEYVTYYKDEAVRLEEKDKNDIELCTITAVEDGKAVLSDNFDAMKANTPFLLKNTTSEEKTILLIPCTEPNLAVTVAKEFKGTEGPCEFSEELMATGDFYVCNGKEFIKVRGAGTLAANKAFLFVEGNNTPASIPFRRSIDGEGEGTTSIDNLNVNDNLNDNEATWYDLNGRKLNGKPAQKGIYIKNGRKVVVK